MTERRITGLKKWNILIWLTVFLFYVFLTQRVFAAEDAASSARNGIVEIQSGFIDDDGTFRKMKSGSGFLITNEQDTAYVVTNNSVVSNSARAIKKYCKKHNIKTINVQLTNTIRIVVKGDVAVEVSVLVRSQEEDYCVLSSENVVSEKSALKLGDSAGIESGDTVYALGFPDGAEDLDFSQADVELREGTIMDPKADRNRILYLQHSAPVTAGNTGGPLLDKGGYVIGLNCKKLTEKGKELYYALPINEIIEVLNNFSIYYGSQGKDILYKQLERLYDECLEISSADGYEKISMEELEQALEAAGEVINKERLQEGDIDSAYQTLTAAKGKLIPKTNKIRAAIIVLAVCILLLLIWLIILIIINAREKSEVNTPQLQSALVMQNTAHPPMEAKMQLIRERTGQTIVVSKNQFVIGSNRTLTDFCVIDNRAVSRKHAVVFMQNRSWHIDDMGSSNGTYVNGTRLVPGKAARIKAGDEVILADEVFRVQEEASR